MIFFHYTCRHAATRIENDGGFVLPLAGWEDLDALAAAHRLPVSGLGDRTPPVPAVSWWTDLDRPDRVGLGLEATLGTCDRTETVFVPQTIPAPGQPDDRFIPWRAFAAEHRPDFDWRFVLELGRLPDRWWVTTTPIAARRGEQTR